MRFFLLFLFFLGVVTAEEKQFVIMVPSYNNAEWFERTLDSIFSQTYQNFRVIYIDDASTDGAGEFVRAYIKERGEEIQSIIEIPVVIVPII